MFPGFSEDTVRFLLDIRFNNYKAYMEARRDEYKAVVQAPFYAFIDDLAPHMLKIDPDLEVRPQKTLSRIYRDTRFSKDKAPYRDHHWVAFRPAGTERYGQPFFWFEFGPDRLSWGAGLWGENREAMNALRQRILSDPEGVQSVLQQCEKHRIAVSGDSFHRFKIPPQVPEPLRALYCMKHIYFERGRIKYEWAFSPDIVSRVAKDFRALKPAWQMMRDAVRDATAEVPGQEKAPRSDQEQEDLWITKS